MSIPAQAISAINYYLTLSPGRSLTKDIAVGICAVLYVESQLNPLAENNSGTETGGAINPKGSYGLEQLNGPRQQGLLDFAKRLDLNFAALETQLHYVLNEAATSYPEMWAAINKPGMTYQEFIPIMVNKFEIPANKQAEIDKALAYADAWYPLISLPTPIPVPAPSNTAVIAQLQDAIGILQSLLKTLGGTSV